MLDRQYQLPKAFSKGKEGYNLSLPIDDHWNDDSTTRKVLVVIETVDSEDLRSGTLLSSRSRIVVTNLLRWSLKQARQDHKQKQTFAFAAVNFNDTKFFDRAQDSWSQYRKAFAKRVHAVISHLEPTNVIVFGDQAMEAMYPDIEALPMKRGWVHKQKTNTGHKYKVTGSLDLERLYRPKKDEIAAAKLADGEEDDEEEETDTKADVFGKANLLFYCGRNVINNLCGRNLFDLSHIKAKPVYVDTIEKFDSFYKKLIRAPIVAFDTETKNLTVHHNAIHTMQFAFGTDRGYFIPYKHPEAEWTAEEQRYIGKKMKRFFARDPKDHPDFKYLVTQYGQFDLRMARQEFGLPIILMPVWDIKAGEWCLDENLKYLVDFRTPHGGLEQIFFYYGNDHYRTAKFSKEDRGNANLTKLSNPEFIEYGVMDVQSIFGIHEQQQERAKRMMVGSEPFIDHYIRMVTIQMSDTIHTISHLQQRGVYLDKKYLRMLMSKVSPLITLMDGIKKELYDTTELKEANKILVKESTNQVSQKGLFNRMPMMFGLTKPAHKVLLFFNVMNLEPVGYTKEKKPKVDKWFIKAYEKNPIVEKYGRWVKMSKLWGTYIKGWYTRLNEDIDCRIDSRLRPDYDFFVVVTGRLNSSKPSLQQVPTRGKEAKYVKKAFTAEEGKIYVVFDYSAHEVRVWSIIAGDLVLAGVFKIGQKLRQMFRRNPSDKLKDKIKKEGDIHIINVKFFFGMFVDKDHPLRDAIKNVVFGVIYGKGAKTLAKDIAPSAEKIASLKSSVAALRKTAEATGNKADKLKYREQKEELAAQIERAESPVEFAKDLITKLFDRFHKGSGWLDWTAQHARDNYYTYSPIKMRRNLFANMTGINSFMGAMDRRAKNSPIQGFASQIGITTARLIAVTMFRLLTKLYPDMMKGQKVLPVEVEKFVHDANYAEVPLDYVLHYIHVMQYEATYGVARHYLKKFGLKFAVEPEIEIQIGASEDNMLKWDWSKKSLEPLLRSVLETQEKEGHLAMGVDKAMEKIMAPYKDRKVRELLESKFPILGVREGDEEDESESESEDEETTDA